MRAISYLFSVLLFGTPVFAGKDYHIFQVKKSLVLNSTDAVYHDYYINAGTLEGLKVGMSIPVSRKVPVHDTYNNETPDDLIVHIGRIKLIHVQKNVSVGRLMSVQSFKNSPVVDYQGVMAGDRVDVGAASNGDEAMNEGTQGPGNADKEEKGAAKKVKSDEQASESHKAQKSETLNAEAAAGARAQSVGGAVKPKIQLKAGESALPQQPGQENTKASQ